MSKKNNDLMGYDPLEWLKGDGDSDSPEKPGGHVVEASTTAQDPVEVTEPAEATAEVTYEQHAEDNREEEVQTVTKDDQILDLETSLQIMDVAILKPKMQKILNSLKEITLRADQNIVVDGAGMQLLLAFVKQASTSDIKLQWEELPPSISEAAKLLNTEQVMLLN